MKSADIPEAFGGYKILQISDFHSKKFPDNNEGLAKTISALKPDIIVATGDMLNAAQDDDGEVFLELIPKIDPDIPIYYAAGNHETVDEVTDPKSAGVYFEQIAELGVVRLDNEKVVLYKDGESIDLYGLETEMTYYRDRRNPNFDKLKLKSEHIEELIGPAENSRFVVLMAHNPLYFEAYANWGADLTLSGHIHGGMIYVPFKGGMFSPEYSLWPQYYAGDYHMGDKVMFVNRGIGSSGTIPVRILDNPEICLITLEKLQ
ncbi:metallophosphoesterase [Eubacterium callanderi]|nr:metallophosphoesterase [Eubacterium callanderi]MCQ4820652.1 metallophosphoesterase [Eubacterium callanderi]MCQ4825260.1 metallophosphoesterase [Eubacterium callanderi]